MLWRDGDTRYANYFKKLLALKSLDISNNNLNFIPLDVFEGLPDTLTKLYITNNRLKSFRWSGLVYLKNLNLLDLSGNYLTDVPACLSNYTKSIQTLVLHKNNIVKLTPNFLKDAFSLKVLDLSYNRIQFIDESNFPGNVVDQLQTLYLNNNRFVCSCNATWFVRWINRTSVNIPRLAMDVTVLHQVPKKVKVWFSSTSKRANTTPYPSSSAFYWHLWFLASSRSLSPAISFFGMFGTSTTSVWPNSRDTVGFPLTAQPTMPLLSMIRLIQPFKSGSCKSFAFNWKTRASRECNSVWKSGIGFLDVHSLKTFPKAYSWVNARFSFWLDDTSRAAASGQPFIWPTSDSWMKGMMLSYWYSWRKCIVIPSTSVWERGCIKNQFWSGRGTLKRRGTSGLVSEISWQLTVSNTTNSSKKLCDWDTLHGLLTHLKL